MESRLKAILIVTVLLIVYFLPSLIAASRRHPNLKAVAFVNLVSGWSVVAWVAVLIWGLYRPGGSMPNKVKEILSKYRG